MSMEAGGREYGHDTLTHTDTIPKRFISAAFLCLMGQHYYWHVGASNL